MLVWAISLLGHYHGYYHQDTSFRPVFLKQRCCCEDQTLLSSVPTLFHHSPSTESCLCPPPTHTHTHTYTYTRAFPTRPLTFSPKPLHIVRCKQGTTLIYIVMFYIWLCCCTISSIQSSLLAYTHPYTSSNCFLLYQPSSHLPRSGSGIRIYITKAWVSAFIILLNSGIISPLNKKVKQGKGNEFSYLPPEIILKKENITLKIYICILQDFLLSHYM